MFERARARWARRSAALALAVGSVGFVLGAWTGLSIELAPPLVGPTFRAQENADNVARMIRNLAEGRTCGETLARLPKVMPASQLRDDPWGNAWSIRCYGDLAVVRSAGADAVFGTYDDIVDVAVGAQVDR